MNKTSTYLLIVVCIAAAIYFWMQNGDASTVSESGPAEVEQIETVEDAQSTDAEVADDEATDDEATDDEATDTSEEEK